MLKFLSVLGIGIIIALCLWTNAGGEYGGEFEGAGTRLSPYQIDSVEKLERFRDLVNAGAGFTNIYFEQTADLDLSEIENWTPIGIYGGDRYFYGIYDGAGHVIRNITCMDNGNGGFFGMLYGEVRNLGIESGYFDGAYLGSITSHGAASASIVNCYNKAAVHGSGRAGGIADNLGGGTIKYCWNLGEITADTGAQYGIASYSATIDSCYCSNLLPAPEARCEVSGTVTFALEELENIKNAKRWQEAEEGLKFIQVNGQTISFAQENMSFKMMSWLKRYWLLLLLTASAIGFLLWNLCTDKEKSKINEEERIITEEEADPFPSKNRGGRKNILAAGVFLAVCFFGVLLISQTLSLKRNDGVLTMRNYYRQPKELTDVLFMGSSRVGINMDLETLWKDYGIAGYACWGSVQPFWNSYYFLQEAVHASRPKIVVLEVGAATYTFEYLDEGRQYTNTYSIKNIGRKISAVQVSAPQERWCDLILGFPIFHARFNELTENDFQYYVWNTDCENYKGGSVIYGSGNYSLEDVSEITEMKKMNAKEEKYFRKIIEYCQEEQIPLTLIATPGPSRAEEQPYYNMVQQIADEYGISFVNFNLLDEETGFKAEDFWTDGHINTGGGRKLSAYLGQYLMSHYAIFDHRGDGAYRSWDVFADNMENSYIKNITEADDYFEELARDGRTAIIIKRDVPDESEAYALFLQKIAGTGYDLQFLSGKEKSFYVVSAAGKQKYDCQQKGYLNLGSLNMIIDFESSGTVSVDGDEIYTLPQEGVVCMVYDAFSDEMIDISAFSEDTQYAVSHQ